MLADVYTMLEAPLNQIENMGSQVTSPFPQMSHRFLSNFKIQVLMSGEVMPAEKVPELIAGITTADVQVTNPCFQTALSKFCFTSDLTLFFQAAAKKLSSAKLSMGACGNLSTVPFLDSL